MVRISQRSGRAIRITPSIAVPAEDMAESPIGQGDFNHRGKYRVWPSICRKSYLWQRPFNVNFVGRSQAQINFPLWTAIRYFCVLPSLWRWRGWPWVPGMPVRGNTDTWTGFISYCNSLAYRIVLRRSTQVLVKDGNLIPQCSPREIERCKRFQSKIG